MPEEGIPLLAHDDILRFEEIAAFARVAVQEGVRTIRITGGNLAASIPDMTWDPTSR